MLIEDLLEGHLAVQFSVQRHEDGTQATPRMRPQHAKPLSVGRGQAHGIGAGAVGVFILVGRALRRADVSERRLDIGAAGARQALSRRPSDGQHGQAFLNVAAQSLNMQTDDGLDDGPPWCIEVPKLDKVVGQGTALVAGPGGECREQHPLVDQAVLQGQ